MKNDLEDQLAAEREKYRISLAVNKDDCETDTNVRNLARPILGDFKVDGDSYGVPGLEDITEQLIAALAAEREIVDECNSYVEQNKKAILQLREQLAAERGKREAAEKLAQILNDQADKEQIETLADLQDAMSRMEQAQQQLAAERGNVRQRGDKMQALVSDNVALRNQLAAEREKPQGMMSGGIRKLDEQLAALEHAVKDCKETNDKQSDKITTLVDALKKVFELYPHLTEIPKLLAKVSDHQHEYDTCVGPPNDPRLGKRICNFCGELEPDIVQLPMINDDPVVSLK